MTFAFNAAASLYRSHKHPRLLLGPAEIASLKKRASTGRTKAVLVQLRKKVQPLIEAVLAAKTDEEVLDSPVYGAYMGTAMMFPLDDIAFVGMFDDHDDAVRAAARVMLAMRQSDLTSGKKGHASFCYGGVRHQACTFDFLADRWSAEERGLIGSWLHEYGVIRTLENLRPAYFRNAGANTRLTGMITALFNTLVLDGEPGLPDLKESQHELILMLEATLGVSFGPAGYPTEDTGYGTGIAAILAPLVEALRRAGLFDAYRQCPNYTRFGRALLAITHPGCRYFSNTGDNFAWIIDRQFVLARLATETRDPALLWMLSKLFYPPKNDLEFMKAQGRVFPELTLQDASRSPMRRFQAPTSYLTLAVLDDLKTAKPPTPRSHPPAFHDPLRGIATFRSSWDDDASYLLVDGSQRSPSCQGHHHDSCGHFNFTALGELFAIDTGRYNIEQDQHNVTIVNGKPGRSTDGHWRMTWYQGQMLGHRADPLCDVAYVDSTVQTDALWAQRAAGLVKSGGVKGVPSYAWTVDDINANNNLAEFWWQLHTSPGNTITIDGDRATVHGCREGNLLDVAFVLPDPKVFPVPHSIALMQNIQRTGSPKYVSDDMIAGVLKQFAGDLPELAHWVPHQRPRLVAKVSGYNGRFMSLMLPRRKGERPAKIERLETIDNTLAARITFERAKVEDVLIWSFEHRILQAAGVKARGKWCLVRRSLPTGKVIARTVADGWFL